MNLIQSDPDLTETYSQFGELCAKKLWHQLTDALEAFLADPASSRGRNLITLYNGFIQPVEGKLSQLRLAGIISTVTRQHYPSRPVDAGEVATAVEFVKTFADRREELGEAVYLLYSLEMVSLQLATGETDGAKGKLEEAKTILDGLMSAEPVVHSKYYGVAKEFFRHQGPPAEYYKVALMYVGTPPPPMLCLVVLLYAIGGIAAA